MAKQKLITWAIPRFPEHIKNCFLGRAKMQGKHPRKLLEHILREWLWEQNRNN